MKIQKEYLVYILLIQNLIASASLKSNEDKRKLEESDDIVIIHVNDVHCGINDTIGYDGFALYRDELKKNYTNLLTVDVGDHVQGDTLGAVSDGSAIIKLMNKIGFNVSTIGNHEFDYGVEQLKKLEENITSRYISSNFCYRKNKTTLFNPYKIVEIGGKKLGFIGAVTPLTLSKTYLSSIKDEDGGLLYDFSAGDDIQALADNIQGHIDKLRNDEKVDHVILLTHIGMANEQYKSEELLSKLQNVDAVLDGHTHKIYNITNPDKNETKVYITQTGTKLESIGKLTIKQNGTILSEIITEVPEPIDKEGAKNVTRKSKGIWVKEEISDFIDGLWGEYSDELNIQVGKCDFDIIIVPEDDNDHDVECRYQECTLGNLAADAVKDAGNAEISILNGGSIRNNMHKGNLTRGQIIYIFPWFNNIVVKEIKGQDILDALEFGVSKYPAISAGFPQVSGITYDIDPNINSTVLTDSSGMFINVTGERRVSNVKINGKDLDLNKTYNASFIEYIANGGDGYSMFSKYEVTNESLVTDTDALVNYIEYGLNGTIPEKYKNYQGRINFKNQTIIIPNTNKYEEEEETLIPSTTTLVNNTNQHFTYFNHKKSGNKLSAGGIIALIVSCVVALAIIAAIALAVRKNNNPPKKMNYYNTSIAKINDMNIV